MPFCRFWQYYTKIYWVAFDIMLKITEKSTFLSDNWKWIIQALGYFYMHNEFRALRFVNGPVMYFYDSWWRYTIGQLSPPREHSLRVAAKSM